MKFLRVAMENRSTVQHLRKVTFPTRQALVGVHFDRSKNHITIKQLPLVTWKPTNMQQIRKEITSINIRECDDYIVTEPLINYNFVCVVLCTQSTTLNLHR